MFTTISSAFKGPAPFLAGDFFEYSEVMLEELIFASKNWNSLLGRIDASSPI